MFDWEEFRNGKVAVHCNTEEKLKDFLEKCEAHNLIWASDSEASKFNLWIYFKEETTIAHAYLNSLGYERKKFYEKEGLKIIDWELVNVKEFTKSDLKDGMVVDLRNGDRLIKLGETITDDEGHLNICGSYNENMTNRIRHEYDIMKVYKCNRANRIEDMLTHDDYLNLIWERKERKPVYFTTAAKAYSEGKKILCEINGLKYPYIPSDEAKSNMGYSLRDNKSGLPISTREILEGKWYIED